MKRFLLISPLLLLSMQGCMKPELSETDKKKYDTQIKYSKTQRDNYLNLTLAYTMGGRFNQGIDSSNQTTYLLNMEQCLKEQKEKRAPFFEGMAFCKTASK